MKTRGLFLFAIALLAGALPAPVHSQQTGSMVVTVTDRQAGTPLEGAQISILQGGASVQGGLTNALGRALFPVLPVGTYDLTVTYLGYGEMTRTGIQVQAGQPTAVNIEAETSVLTLDELVVTGMVDPTTGIKVPFTVAKVGTEQLQVAASGSAPLSALAGKVAGLNVQQASGRPGETASILLRSATSFEGSNQPLIVVDGVIFSTTMTNGDALSDIESMDIIDFEVIKGAAAASLYGSRAAAGVIAITTARGRTAGVGQTRVTLRSEFGKDFIAGEIPLTNSHPYLMNAAGTSLVNSEGRDTTWNGRTTRVVSVDGGNARMMDQPYPGKIYDNVSGVYKPDQYLSSNFSLAQNNENTQFLIGLSRLDQNGALENNDGFWRNTGRVSIDHRMGNLSLSFTGSHSRQWQDGISGNPYTSLLTYPAYVDLTKKGPDGEYLQQPDPTVEMENPIWRQASRDNYSERARTLGSMNVRFAPTNWLTFDARVSYDLSNDFSQVYVPKGVPLDLTGDNPSDGRLDLESEATQGANGSFGATLMRQFGELNVRFTSRGSFEREENEWFSSDGRDFMVTGVRDLGASLDLYGMGSGTSLVKSNGILGDLALDYKDRYILSFLLRYDGSSLFGDLERWQAYKRASAAYVISREDWFDVPFINELKLRYAMGEAGGRPGFTWQYETWNMSRSTGLSKNTAGNRSLRPEFTREHDIGIDMIAFNNRLQLELVYAKQTTTDNIIVLPATVISGYNSFRANAAKVSGRTYEMTLTAFPVRTRDLTWSITAVADNSVNTLEEWGRACFYGSNAGRSHEYTCAGQRAGSFFMQQTVRSTDQLPSWLQDRTDEFVVNDEGYLVWVGKRADGTTNSWGDGIAIANQSESCAGSADNISGGCGWGSYFTEGGFTYRWGEPFRAYDEEAQQTLRELEGQSLPDLGFGFGSNVRYKGITAYFLFRGQIGGKVYNNAKQWAYNNLRHGDLDQTGKPDETKKTLDYYRRGIGQNNSGWVDSFLEDGDFLKLGEARLSYRMEQSQLSRLFGSKAPYQVELGVNARNLFTLTGYSGLNPEVGSPLSRVENVGYPLLRSVTFTASIVY